MIISGTYHYGNYKKHDDVKTDTEKALINENLIYCKDCTRCVIKYPYTYCNISNPPTLEAVGSEAEIIGGFNNENIFIWDENFRIPQDCNYKLEYLLLREK